MMTKSYSELIKLPTYKERLEYLMLYGKVGTSTFGKERHLNQALYHSYSWNHDVRPKIIIRDNGCDLGVDGYLIMSKPIIHHINPITIEDILDRNPIVFDPENLILVSRRSHDIIHYAFTTEGIEDAPIVRTPNDTKLW